MVNLSLLIFSLISKKMLKFLKKKKLISPFFGFNSNFIPKTTHILNFFIKIIKDCLNYLFYTQKMFFHEYIHKKGLLKSLEIAVFTLKIIFQAWKSTTLDHTHKTTVKKFFKILIDYLQYPVLGKGKIWNLSAVLWLLFSFAINVLNSTSGLWKCLRGCWYHQF